MSNDSTDSADKDCSVRVAVRIRPQNARELIDMCRLCTTVTPGEPQIVMGLDKAFTFDCVFDGNSTQSEIYASCVEKLVEGALRGYNATVLAYGQTGSGKTFTMGTGFDSDNGDQQQGIIPRAVRHIFDGIDTIHCQDAIEDETRAVQSNIQFSVGVQFTELYNEEIIDLLDPYNKGRSYKIHEDASGQISVSGITIKPISNPQEALKCLKQGALARSTASTQMNDQSSRSHALFTILIRRQRIMSSTESGLPDGDLETLTSKFHFVDLAGSERLKRTGATGDRAREGISINCGLLALGNCISALGDKSKKATHVPYRDSKLTRLLQDSLGGNSETLMIACISPSDRDFMETLNTLKYANRARNIKNKVQLNQDQSSRTITQLRREIAALQLELLEYKQGKRLTDAEGNSLVSDTYNENTMLAIDNKILKQRLKAMQATIQVLTESNTRLKLEKETYGWGGSLDISDERQASIISSYIMENQQLQTKIIELKIMYSQLENSLSTKESPRGNVKSINTLDDAEDVLNLAKRKVEKERGDLMSRSLPGFDEDAQNCNVVEKAASESDDSDTESDEKTKEIEEDLDDINSDIEIKTKLIEQLELSQKRMQLMRVHYEEKLNVLNHKITNTQKERDDILANMSGNHGNQPSDKVKKVREEYERKLSEMQSELKRLQSAQREHARQQREMQSQEVKLQNLHSELNELKSIKTRLMRKMAEQSSRHREEETRKTREIAQLRKMQRRHENTMRTLQAQVHTKEQILKRKNEEVTALRRDQRALRTQRIGGRKVMGTSKVDNKPTEAAFNARAARHHWDNMSRAISRSVRNKQAVMQFEKELERLLSERGALIKELTNVRGRQRKARSAELANEEDSIKSNLNYVQENIEQVQQSIMSLEENKDRNGKSEDFNLQNVIANVSNVEEAKFLLERLTENAIATTCNSAVNEGRLLEHEAMLKELKQENGIQQQLLHHILTQNLDIQISDLVESLNIGGMKYNNLQRLLSGSQKSLASNGTYDIPNDLNARNNDNQAGEAQKSRSSSVSPTPTIDVSQDRNGKIRQRTALPQELLFGESNDHQNGNDVMTRSYTQHEPMTRNYQPLIRVPSAPGSLKQVLNSQTKAKVQETAIPTIDPASPRASRRAAATKDTTAGFVTNVRDDEMMGLAPASPPVYRRMVSREDTSNGDVFSRLGAGQQGPAPGGHIHRVTGKIRAGVPLYCTHTVSGHNSSVLSIKVEDNILYTAAADRTVKVWDLVKETAVHCLSLHPGPVIAVQNDAARRLLISASGPFARVWDLRTSNTKPIKTLSSTGQVLSGNATVTGLTPGESPITALCLGVSGNLYMAASDKVRIWDLNSLTCIGKLSGGHQAAVMCVTAWEGDGIMDFVATGSKDHYVKVFEVSRSGGVTYPLLNLEPPHYDGVQALAVAPNATGADAELFSGSRDSGIKRWDLKSGELKQSLNNAHKGWVSGMAISGDILLSGCRGGIIRLWNVKTCESLAEMKTDLIINDIVAQDQRVFTASGDGQVRVWRLTNSLRRQCSLESS